MATKRGFAKKNCRKALLSLLFLFLFSGLFINIAAYAAAPSDENYDDDFDFLNTLETTFDLDGIRYTLTDVIDTTIVVNDITCPLGNGGTDYYMSFIANSIQIESVDGSAFKLNGFSMDAFADTNVTITASSGATIIKNSYNSWVTESIDLLGNSDFENITSFAISGNNMILSIDDLDFSSPVLPTYTVTYDGNSNTGGTAPTDGNTYNITDTVTVLGENTLVKTNYTFTEWNTAPNGSGSSYSEDDTFVMGSSNITLYAQWTENVYAVTYNGNSNTGGAVPTDGTHYNTTDTATVLGNTGSLVRTGYTFAGWNTLANGSGTSYSKDDTFAMGSSNTTLYAQWTENVYAVTYNGNTNTGGTAPTDGNTYNITDTVTVLGENTLVKVNYTFKEWNTAPNGSGTSYLEDDTFAMGSSSSSNTTLYAQWTENVYAVTYNGNSNTGGAVPTDGTHYNTTDTATVLGNTGSLVRTGYTFAGWNTLANGSGTSYSGGDSFTIGSSDVTLYAQWTAVDYTVTYDGNTNTGGTVPTDGNVYHITDAVTVLGNTGTLVKTGYTFAGWNTVVNGSGISYNGGNTFAMENGNVTLYANWVTAVNSGGDSSGSGSSSTINQPSQAPVVVIVNDEKLNAGSERMATENGKTTVNVTVNNELIESKIDEAMNKNTTGTENVIQVSVTDKLSEVVNVELTGDIIKKLEENNYNISIKRNNIEYIILAEEFTISKVAENLGVVETDLVDIKVEVRIAKLDEKVIKKYNEVAKTYGAELIFPPVSFEVVAKTTKADGTTGEVGISKFNNYVERVMEIPVGVDPSKISTGIVFNLDGTYSHVPTVVYQKDGRWYASLNSLTNSNYSVIWNPITVKTVENHWSKDAVNDMASRLVIFNIETFSPDKAISRADFAEYIVRALGLYREESKHVNTFSDVSSTGDRTPAILIASEYSIVSGYPDGSFRPNMLITREEAMTMYQRAMLVTKLIGTDRDRYQSFSDYDQVGSWATPYVKAVLSAHVFNGTTQTMISPKSNLTYAEAAKAIKNLLVESKLINK